MPSPAVTSRYVEQVMGMPVSLALRGRHQRDGAADAAWRAVIDSLREVDRVFSTYRDDSVISRLGRGELTVDDCPPEVHEVLALGAAATADSHGAFAVWRAGPDGRRVLDPNGVVKGWAVERAAAALLALDDTDFCVSAGGDMYCHTQDPAGSPWRIGIEDPADPSRVVAIVPVHNGAVATSGATHRGSHVVDARTGQPPSGVASVTVIAASLTDADIDATAAFAMGRNAADWLGTRAGRIGFVVWSDGSAITVGG
jgi:thiamine biosynthesis lipoprotein